MHEHVNALSVGDIHMPAAKTSVKRIEETQKDATQRSQEYLILKMYIKHSEIYKNYG